MDVNNIYTVPANLPEEEYTEIIFEDSTVRIERIISSGQISDWYDQEELEYVLLLQGSALLEFDHREVELTAGDYLIIEPHEKHRVTYTSGDPKTVWICIFRK